jgi:hypothetical protein
MAAWTCGRVAARSGEIGLVSRGEIARATTATSASLT